VNRECRFLGFHRASFELGGVGIGRIGTIDLRDRPTLQ